MRIPRSIVRYGPVPALHLRIARPTESRPKALERQPIQLDAIPDGLAPARGIALSMAAGGLISALLAFAL